MGKIIITLLSPITLTRFIRFSFVWAIIAVGIELCFLLFAGRSLNIVSFFLGLSILGLAFSYSPFGMEFKENRLKLDWWQALRSTPAVLLILWLSRYPDALSMKNPQSSMLVIVFVGFWSSQLAAVLRSFFK